MPRIAELLFKKPSFAMHFFNLKISFNVNEFSYSMKFSIGEGNIRQKVLDDFNLE